MEREEGECRVGMAFPAAGAARRRPGRARRGRGGVQVMAGAQLEEEGGQQLGFPHETLVQPHTHMCILQKSPPRDPSANISLIPKIRPSDFRSDSAIVFSMTREGVSTRNMIADQQLAIFLFGVDNSVANRILAETFQHSGETISRYFNNGVRGIVRLKDEYIMFPSSNVVVHPNNIVVQIGFSRKHSNIQEKLSVDILTTLYITL
uniref:DUF8040 domain-containing protein n=1 Tax=Ananas comosus var. bracteatus TaxID=296719 RepID=A0A6V7QBM0_ANACO|nr:unnamed protein product [Ananas comosus var. bracteatus]